jgi:exodeoxyribonuclease III
MRIVSWNVQGLRKNVSAPAISEALLRHDPTIIALHEFNPRPFGEALGALLSSSRFERYGQPVRSSPFRTIVFARPGARLLRAPQPLGVDDPFWIELRFGALGLSAAHIPIKGQDREAHWRAALSVAHSVGDGLHLLIGDLNTTLHGIDEEHAAVPGQEYLQQLSALGWVEGWRKLNANAREYSWHHPSPPRNGFRLDQVWLSPSLIQGLLGATMDHDVRTSGLSDHSMLIIDLSV